MRRLTVLISVVALLLMSAAPVLADHNRGGTQSATVSLAGGNEVPTVETDGSGIANFRVDGDSVEYRLAVFGVDNVTQAHIHLGPEGENGPVVAFLFGFVEGGVSEDGVLAKGTITAADLIGPLAGQSIDDLLDAMEAGNIYVNVHTVANPAGEVRGQIELP